MIHATRRDLNFTLDMQLLQEAARRRAAYLRSLCSSSLFRYIRLGGFDAEHVIERSRPRAMPDEQEQITRQEARCGGYGRLLAGSMADSPHGWTNLLLIARERCTAGSASRSRSLALRSTSDGALPPGEIATSPSPPSRMSLLSAWARHQVTSLGCHISPSHVRPGGLRSESSESSWQWSQ